MAKFKLPTNVPQPKVKIPEAKSISQIQLPAGSHTPTRILRKSVDDRKGDDDRENYLKTLFPTPPPINGEQEADAAAEPTPIRTPFRVLKQSDGIPAAKSVEFPTSKGRRAVSDDGDELKIQPIGSATSLPVPTNINMPPIKQPAQGQACRPKGGAEDKKLSTKNRQSVKPNKVPSVVVLQKSAAAPVPKVSAPAPVAVAPNPSTLVFGRPPSSINAASLNQGPNGLENETGGRGGGSGQPAGAAAAALPKQTPKPRLSATKPKNPAPRGKNPNKTDEDEESIAGTESTSTISTVKWDLHLSSTDIGSRRSWKSKAKISERRKTGHVIRQPITETETGEDETEEEDQTSETDETGEEEDQTSETDQEGEKSPNQKEEVKSIWINPNIKPVDSVTSSTLVQKPPLLAQRPPRVSEVPKEPPKNPEFYEFELAPDSCEPAAAAVEQNPVQWQTPNRVERHSKMKGCKNPCPPCPPCPPRQLRACNGNDMGHGGGGGGRPTVTRYNRKQPQKHHPHPLCQSNRGHPPRQSTEGQKFHPTPPHAYLHVPPPPYTKVIGTRFTPQDIFPAANLPAVPNHNMCNKLLDETTTANRASSIPQAWFRKDFIRLNALETTRLVPKRAPRQFVDDWKGHKQNYCESGMARHFVYKADYGKMPEYLVNQKRCSKTQKSPWYCCYDFTNPCHVRCCYHHHHPHREHQHHHGHHHHHHHNHCHESPAPPCPPDERKGTPPECPEPEPEHRKPSDGRRPETPPLEEARVPSNEEFRGRASSFQENRNPSIVGSPPAVGTPPLTPSGHRRSTNASGPGHEEEPNEDENESGDEDHPRRPTLDHPVPPHRKSDKPSKHQPPPYKPPKPKPPLLPLWKRGNRRHPAHKWKGKDGHVAVAWNWAKEARREQEESTSTCGGGEIDENCDDDEAQPCISEEIRPCD